MTKKWKTSLVGAGSMGRHHARVLKQLSRIYDFVGLFDENTDEARRIATLNNCIAFETLEDAIKYSEVVFIATPTVTHREIACNAIEKGRHVFIEKPLADSPRNAKEIVILADRFSVKLGVGHTERFNPVTQWIIDKIRSETVLSINIERIGPKPPRVKDVGIVTDLSVHDLDLISFLSRGKIEQVSCVGRATKGEFEDVAQIIISTNNGVIGSINTNWLTPFKSRIISVATDKRFIVGDLMRFSARVYANLDTEYTERYGVEEAIIKWKEPLELQSIAYKNYLDGDENSGTVSGTGGLGVLNLVENCLNDLSSRR